MALDDDLRTAIDKNLSSQVGTVLKQRLEHAERDAALAEEWRQKNGKLMDEIAELRGDLERFTQWESKLEELQERERGVELSEKLIAQEREFHSHRLNDLKELTAAVFKGPASRMAFDFSASGVNPGQMNAQGYLNSDTFPSVTGSATVEKTDG